MSIGIGWRDAIQRVRNAIERRVSSPPCEERVARLCVQAVGSSCGICPEAEPFDVVRIPGDGVKCGHTFHRKGRIHTAIVLFGGTYPIRPSDNNPSTDNEDLSSIYIKRFRPDATYVAEPQPLSRTIIRIPKLPKFPFFSKNAGRRSFFSP